MLFLRREIGGGKRKGSVTLPEAHHKVYLKALSTEQFLKGLFPYAFSFDF